MADYKTLAEALAAFQAVVPKMSKDETAKVKSEKANYSYGYAGLDQFVEIVEPMLGQHGLAITSRTTFVEGQFTLEVSLVHEGGERETALWPLPDPRRFGPQEIGSSMTYGRRYLGWGLTGTFPGGIDDDGAKAQTSARESWEDATPVRPQQAQRNQQPQQGSPAQRQVQQAPKTSWTDAEVAEILGKLASTHDTAKALGAYDWMAGKKLHNRVVPLAEVGDRNATQVIAELLGDHALRDTATVSGIADLRNQAADRGLLKIQVDGDDSLEKVLHEARDLALHAAATEASQDTPGSENS